MKKNTKLITLLLAFVLLVGAAVGITVAAEESDTPAISVAGQNLSYEGAVRVAYYVEARELEDNERVVLLVSNSEIAIIEGYAIDKDSGYALKEVEESITVDGKGTYSVLYSDGVKTSELRKSIYAVAAIVETTDKIDTVVEFAAAPVYSPFTYAMNRFDGEYTEDQAKLYTALLDYGASVQQVVFEGDEEKVAKAGGWADAYYVVSEKVVVNGDTVTDFTAEHRAAELQGDYAPEIGKWYGNNKDQLLVSLTDAEGERLFGTNYADNWNKATFGIGTSSYIATYATTFGKYVTYAGAVANVLNGEKGTVSNYANEYFLEQVSDTYLNWSDSKDSTKTTTVNGYTYTYKARGQAYVNDAGKLTYERALEIIKISDGTTELTEAGQFFTDKAETADVVEPDSMKVGEVIAASAGSMVNSLQLNTVPAPDVEYVAKKHIYETDISVDFNRAGGNGHIGQMFLSVSNTNTPYIWSFNFYGNNDDETYYISVNSASNLTAKNESNKDVTYTSNIVESPSTIVSGLKEGTTYNIRVEAYPDVYGEGTILVFFYLDGELKGTYISHYDAYEVSQEMTALDREMYSVRFGIPSNGRDCHFYLDNTYVASEYVVEDYLGNGKYNNVNGTVDFGNGADSRVANAASAISAKDLQAKIDAIGTESATNFVNVAYPTDENGNTYFKYAAHNGANTTFIYSENKYGDTYVLSTDFKWMGSTSNTASDSGGANPWFLRMGFRSIGSTTGGDDTMFYVQGASYAGAAANGNTAGRGGEDLYLVFGSGNDVTTAFAILELGVWYNIRIEYTPVSCTVKDNGDYVSVGTVKVYVDGELVFTKANHSQTELPSSTNNLSFDHAYIQGRGAGIVDDYGYCLDNVYCNAISKNYATSSEADPDEYLGLGYAGIDYDMDSISAENAALAFSENVTLNENVTTTINNATYVTAGMKDWARIATEGNNKVLEFGSQTAVNSYATWYADETEGEKYVFSTDLKWLGSYVMNSHKTINKVTYENRNDNWLFKLGLISADPAGNYDANILPIYGWVNANDNVELRLGKGEGETVLAVIEAGEWYDLSVEYVPAKDGDSFVGEVKVLLDGETVYSDTYTGKGNIDNNVFYGTFIEYRAFSRDVVMRFDNTFTGAVSDYEIGGGINNKNAIKFDGTNEYTNNKFEGNTFEVVKEGENNVLSIVKKATPEMNNGAIVTFAYTASTAAATSYVYELDMKLLTAGLSMPEAQEGTWTTKLAIRDKNNVELDQLVFTPVKNADGAVTDFAISVDTTTDVLGYISADEWHNIRIVFTPEGGAGMTKDILIDGAYVINDAPVSQEGTKATVDKSTFGYALIQLRGLANYAAALVDNVYLGTINGKSVTEADVYDFSGTDPETPLYLGNASMTVKSENDNSYFNVVKSVAGKTTGESKFFFTPTSDDSLVAMAPGATYVFEMKFRVNEIVNATYNSNGTVANAGSNWLAYIGFTDDIFTDNDANTINKNILETTASKVGDNTVYDAKDTVLFGQPFSSYKEWMDIKIELYIGSIASNGTASVVSCYYVDDELVYRGSDTTKLQAINGIQGVKIKTKSFGTGDKPNLLDMDFDDVKLYSYYMNPTTASGMGLTGKLNFNFENGSTGFFATTSSLGTTNDNNWTAAHTKMGTEDGNTYLNVNANHENNSSGAALIMFNDVDDILLTAQVGSVYELSYRIRFNELLNQKGNVANTDPFGTTWAFYAGVASTTGAYADDTATHCYTYKMTRVAADAENYPAGPTNTEYAYPTGEWIDVTFVYKVTAVTDTSITMDSFMIVNGKIIGYADSSNKKVGGASSQTNSYTKNNVTYTVGDVTGFCLKINGVDTNKSNGRLYSYDIDFDDITIKSYNTK